MRKTTNLDDIHFLICGLSVQCEAAVVYVFLRFLRLGIFAFQYAKCAAAHFVCLGSEQDLKNAVNNTLVFE